jgi:hypothetical protein
MLGCGMMKGKHERGSWQEVKEGVSIVTDAASTVAVS